MLFFGQQVPTRSACRVVRRMAKVGGCEAQRVGADCAIYRAGRLSVGAKRPAAPVLGGDGRGCRPVDYSAHTHCNRWLHALISQPCALPRLPSTGGPYTAPLQRPQRTAAPGPGLFSARHLTQYRSTLFVHCCSQCLGQGILGDLCTWLMSNSSSSEHVCPGWQILRARTWTRVSRAASHSP